LPLRFIGFSAPNAAAGAGNGGVFVFGIITGLSVKNATINGIHLLLFLDQYSVIEQITIND
jgi:hypothetical protein